MACVKISIFCWITVPVIVIGLDAPISIPEPTHLSIGQVRGIGWALKFTDWHGVEYSGEWHEDTGCYVDWDGEFGSVIVALCYDGERSLDIWYGSLKWDGHQGVLSGPWLFHIYAYAPTDPWPMFGPGEHQAVVQ